jgi:hypothetical protein
VGIDPVRHCYWLGAGFFAVCHAQAKFLGQENKKVSQRKIFDQTNSAR